ncbi:amino acid racemase [Leptothoe sp. EHU-05/26/07-4]
MLRESSSIGNRCFQEKPMLGVIGGMGPLTSAEFIKTIYELNLTGKKEQNAPRVILYSDPSFPDRTEAFLKGDNELLLGLLVNALKNLYAYHVSEVVICCITSHYLLPDLPSYLRVRVTSLIDIVLSKVIENKENYLLLCTKGTRKLKIFQNNNLWQSAKNYITFLDEHDQDSIHRMIYQIKGNRYKLEDVVGFLKKMKHKYRADFLIAGCTEFHILNRDTLLQNNQECPLFLDPLTIIAEKMSSLDF